MPTTLLAQALYTYDAVGNRATLTDRLGLHQYGYDALNRLIQATNPTETFSYDPVGNRLTAISNQPSAISSQQLPLRRRQPAPRRRYLHVYL
ncbi:MAG: RHS repeat protein [Candidatus Omnitrophica bacterium]|nr:RHS repeat protein [Candidatus Omnitrophota bacterium]